MSEEAVARELAQALISDGGFGPGAQLWSSDIDGRRAISVEIGMAGPGREMRSWTMTPVWCASKPILGMLAAAIAERAGLAPDEPIASVLPRPFREIAGELTLGSLLSHNAGLGWPPLSAVMANSPDARPELLRSALGSRSERNLAAYSQWATWALLELIVEEEYRCPTALALDELLRAAGLYGLKHSPPAPDEIGAWWGVRPGRRPIPMLGHLLDSSLARMTPAVGGLASMEGLGRWYQRLGNAWDGQSDDDSRNLFPTRGYLIALDSMKREEIADDTLGRECGFSAGMMHSLSGHGYGSSLSSRAYGHSGWLGTCFGFVDLENRVVAAGLVNGIDLQEPQRIEAIRSSLVALCLSEARSDA